MAYAAAARRGVDWLVGQDSATLERIGRWRGPRAAAMARMLTRAGDTGSWFVHCGVLLSVGGGNSPPVAPAAVLAVLLATGVSQGLKRSLRRPRPTEALAGFAATEPDPDAFSMPSGHTAAACSVATATFSLAPALGAAEWALAAGIAASRIVLGAHYPLDVLVGAALGVACGRIALTVLGLG